jgi:hypothetical protein
LQLLIRDAYHRKVKHEVAVQLRADLDELLDHEHKDGDES